MNKKLAFLSLAALLAATSLFACTGSNKGGSSATTAPAGKYNIVRKAILNGKWQMYQFQINLPSNGEFDIDFLDMVEGDRVDGYFYPEKGTGVSLQITAGTTPVYTSPALSLGTTTSDRFSFGASQPKGTAYVLLFKNIGTDKEVTVFVEVVYPTTARIRGPLDLK